MSLVRSPRCVWSLRLVSHQDLLLTTLHPPCLFVYPCVYLKLCRHTLSVTYTMFKHYPQHLLECVGTLPHSPPSSTLYLSSLPTAPLAIMSITLSLIIPPCVHHASFPATFVPSLCCPITRVGPSAAAPLHAHHPHASLSSPVKKYRSVFVLSNMINPRNVLITTYCSLVVNYSH